MCSIANASTKQPVVYFRACLSEDVVMHSKAECHKVGWLSRLGILYSLILYSFDNKRLWSQGPWEKEEEGKEEKSPNPAQAQLIYPSSRDQQGSLPRFWSTVSLRVTPAAAVNPHPAPSLATASASLVH